MLGSFYCILCNLCFAIISQFFERRGDTRKPPAITGAFWRQFFCPVKATRVRWGLRGKEEPA